MSDQNANIDFNEVLRFAQNLSKNQDPYTPPTLAPIDKATNNQKMRILKASLPYFDFSQQRSLAMAIKMLEFRKTLEVFNEPTPLHTEFQQKKAVSSLEFLQDIKNSCDEPSQKKLNMLIMLMNMQHTMEAYKTDPKMLSSVPEGTPTPSPTTNKEPTKDSYSEFMNMVNKIIDEKDEEKNGDKIF